MRNVCSSHFVPLYETRLAYIQAWESAARHFLDEGNLSPDVERSLVLFQQKCALGDSELDEHGVREKVVKAAVLRDLLNGQIPERIELRGSNPFNFQKNELAVWFFSGVDYLEDKTRTEYVGRSSGVSIRIAKGLYYRVGAFHGQPISRTERVHVDSGLMAVTTKHLYFAGPQKSLRIRHDKIVSFTPFSDGIGIVRDATTAKPQIFITGDGWFTYNLLANVSKI